MTNNTIQTQEFNCPYCGEKINVQILESGEIIITPFILPETIEKVDGYEFG